MQTQKACLIVRVRVETYSVLRVEDVRGGRVVHYDDFAELSAQSAEVFDVVPSVEHAGFPEEARTEHTPLIEQICHGVSILHTHTHA